MPSSPYPILAEDQNEQLTQMQSLLDDLYQNRLGGANVGDVFQVGADDVFQLRYLAIGGLQKIAGALAIKPDTAKGIDSSADGVCVKLRADYGLAHHADGLYVKLKSGGGITVTANGLELTTIASAVRGTFVNADLSTGVLTIAHLKALTAPYTVSVTIFNNSGVQVIPDSVTGTTNNVAVDISSYGAISGVWGYEVL